VFVILDGHTDSVVIRLTDVRCCEVKAISFVRDCCGHTAINAMFTFTPNTVVSSDISNLVSASALRTQAVQVHSHNTGRWFILKRSNAIFEDSLVSDDMSRGRFVHTLSNVTRGENCRGGSCRFAFDDSLTSSYGIADIHSSYGNVQPNSLWLTKSQATLSLAHGGIPFSEKSKRLCASCSACNAEADLTVVTAECLARTDVSTVISNVFWKMALTFHSFNAGDLSSSPHLLVEYASLWSSAEHLGSLLPEFCLNMSGSIEVFCRIAIYARVQQLLKTLIEHNIVGWYYKTLL